MTNKGHILLSYSYKDTFNTVINEYENTRLCITITTMRGKNVILYSLFEKLRDAREKTLLCKNRKTEINRMISIE